MDDLVNLENLPVEQVLLVASREAGKVLNRAVLLNWEIDNDEARLIFSKELLRVITLWMNEQRMSLLFLPGYLEAIDDLETMAGIEEEADSNPDGN